ncbi:hypothetical protein Tco_0632509 [Tanacetum coccineum]
MRSFCPFCPSPSHPIRGSLDGSNRFSVASGCELVDSHILDVDLVAIRWNRSIPIKVNVFLWRLKLNGLPSRVNLDRKVTVGISNSIGIGIGYWHRVLASASASASALALTLTVDVFGSGSGLYAPVWIASD